MKKAVKIALPILLIGLILTTQTTKSTYQVSVGNTFVYDVIESSMSVTHGINSTDTQGFEIEGQYFNPGNSVTLNVTDVQPTDVTFNISAGAYSELRQSDLSDLSMLFLYMVSPIYYTEAISTMKWNSTIIESLIHEEILMIPFLSVVSDTWNDWIDVVTGINNNGTILGTTYANGFAVSAAYYNTSIDFVFEFVITGVIDEVYVTGTSSSILNMTIDHQYQFAYTKATGVMLGMRMEGEVSGTANGTIIEYTYDYHTEKQGYDLPSYQLGGPTWPFPGFEYLIALGALGTLTTIMVIVRRRKK
ncbi:MAG: choice-of-anchor S family protein [Candidatus Heimdallarchaeota archaeon]